MKPVKDFVVPLAVIRTIVGNAEWYVNKFCK